MPEFICANTPIYTLYVNIHNTHTGRDRETGTPTEIARETPYTEIKEENLQLERQLNDAIKLYTVNKRHNLVVKIQEV